MSIFSNNDSGTSFHKSRFTKSISNRMDYDTRFFDVVPVLKRFCLPGDIWRIGGDVLVRFQPMRTPTLTPNNFRVRYFFVPLRLIENNTELIITGSQDGKLYAPTEDHPDTPVFDSFVTNANKVYDPNAYKVQKHSFWDYMNVQVGDYENIKNIESLPANYFMKAYERIRWDYYDDENLSYTHATYNSFDSFMSDYVKQGCNIGIFSSSLPKDYFSSCLPWQLKGTAPRIDVSGSGTINFTPSYSGSLIGTDFYGTETDYNQILKTNVPNDLTSTEGFKIFPSSSVDPDDVQQIKNAFNGTIKNFLQQQQTANVNVTQLGFTADDLRTMMAQTRIFERLARCGSRYTEYLHSNFGIAPADETLQRAQYLGGWKVPIVTTEVLQTAADGAYPVGTMRGHGITRGGNRINTFVCKEFGVLFGLAEVRPDIQYTTGIPRQLTYKRRWDFFNPSLQHLSEQEVRNSELFVDFSSNDNDNTFGFQAYGNELRSYQNETVGDLRDSLSDWNQALHFNSRPNLNNAFISGASHRASFNAPFVVNSSDSYPIIVQFYNNLDVYRPMVRYATPGLVDHL